MAKARTPRCERQDEVGIEAEMQVTAGVGAYGSTEASSQRRRLRKTSISAGTDPASRGDGEAHDALPRRSRSVSTVA